MTTILGISAFYHDSAACVLVDGELMAAAQEERFTRRKHDPEFPRNAIRFCLAEAGVPVEKLDYVGFYDKPLVKFLRILETYLENCPKGFFSFLKAMPLWLRQKLWMRELIRTELAKIAGAAGEKEAKTLGESLPFTVLFGDHHESHAASAFYPSPFEESAILTIDGVGEWATSSIGYGKGNEVTLLQELRFPDSLGLLYSAFTYYTGFKVNSGEYKVMGLAPYGEPKYVRLMKERLVEVCEDGSLHLNQDYFGYSHALRMTNRAFNKLFGGNPRRPEEKITQRECDLARSIQEVTEEAMLRMSRFAYERTGSRRLCMAGGVALNCVGNGKILRDGIFDELWVQPAAGDAGGAVGAAFSIWHRYLDRPRNSPERMGAWEPGSNGREGVPLYTDGMMGAYLGPRATEEQIDRFLAKNHLPHVKCRGEEIAGVISDLLIQEKVIGLHQGRMEFGPRALGARSIIGDARSPKMQSLMNLKIKFRESFRPFAPSIMREHLGDWFDLNTESPYMLLVADVDERRRRALGPQENALQGMEKLSVIRSDIPAVTHVDYSARIHSVRREVNPFFWSILESFWKKTGCPVIVNTSFNVRGEPIVCSLEDSYRCFMRTEMDCLVLENYLLMKEEQPRFEENENWKKLLTAD